MSLKILLADDSVTAQNMGKKILSDAGFEVVAVSNGSAALKKIPEVKPDLVILDIYMPGYSGLEVCQRIKDSKQTVSLPVLLTVGKLEPFKARDASRVRADGFIVKPFEATELLATIKRIVGVLPEGAGAGKKNGQDSKVRVKEAKLASQAASAEQLASALKNVLPSESKFETREESKRQQSHEEYEEPSGAVEAAVEEPAPAAEPFSVSRGSEPSDEESYSEPKPDSTKFHVDFDKRDRPPERHDDGIPFRASTFESWEKAHAPTPAEIASREDALARIRAARQNEAEEAQEGGLDPEATVVLRRPTQPDASATQARPGSELDPDATLSLDNTTWQAISEAGKPSTPEAIGATPPIEEEVAQTSSQSEAPSGTDTAPAIAEAPAPHVSANQASAPISGLADWASDLHETSAASPAAEVPIAAKWIAEEVPLASGDSSLSLSDEMHRFGARAEESPSESVPESQHDEITETPAIETAAAIAVENREPEDIEAVAEPAAPQASEEQVAALAKAAAAAAISSISEIREAVLASAAAAGASGIGSDSVTIQSQSGENSPDQLAPDMAQFAAQPSTPTSDDIQGATIAAVTREVAEVAETASADLNSDAIASIVNRVIEQMKPKLVAEIAKELTHKPKNE